MVNEKRSAARIVVKRFIAVMRLKQKYLENRDGR
jgi:hypothetical protein